MKKFIVMMSYFIGSRFYYIGTLLISKSSNLDDKWGSGYWDSCSE